MADEKLDEIASNLMMFFPLFYKKLLKDGHKHPQVALSNPQCMVLGILKGRGPLPTSEIGKRLYISKPNMTSIIDRLIEEGYVERLSDGKDRRIVNVSITGSGMRVLMDHKKTMTDIIKGNLSCLSEKDLETLSISLERIKETFSKIEESE
jgi:DNA-binding MarR family transcriptional regulator